MPAWLVPAFSPFRGVVYNAEGGYVDDVVAPPYDVISAEDRAALVSRSDYNAVRLELPESYASARELWERWLSDRVLVADDEPAFYAYRMGFHDEAGRARQTTGVLGALELSEPGAGEILPHEHTTSKDKSDRLELLRATRVNLSPIWSLTTAEGLSSIVDPSGPPDIRATDAGGIHHRVWRITAPAAIDAIRTAVGSGPVLVADGHHRFEVANAYRAERGGDDAGARRILSFVVELSAEQLSVRAIHRLVSGLPDGVDLAGALEAHFELSPTGPPDATILSRMEEAGALALVLPDRTLLLKPRAATVEAAAHDLDSSRLDVALAGLPSHELRFQHGWDLAAAAVEKSEAQAAVLLRPATVTQIADISRGGTRMPPKTTFFYPKPATGLVFRGLDLDADGAGPSSG
ncbi:MAG TPA: DUF1015 domain-containing protein [Acidimicrobiales bacterium]|nr:DUF1015 domain-containing protein [Acidimicrobiales bacterium]